jgi:2-polyprenyl-3-methyl-5-hydroxy-6-metoxy-1,4-benzoquinol methylase
MPSVSATTVTSPIAVRTEGLVRCPTCGGPRLSQWSSGRDRLHELSRQEFVYSRCRDCHTLFQSTRPCEAEAYKFYPDDYSPHRGSGDTAAARTDRPARPRLLSGALGVIAGHALATFEARVSRRLVDDLRGVLNEFYRPPAPGARLLDFGCGSDAFLNWARDRGWSTPGLDAAPRSVERVRQSGHVAYLMSPSVWDEIEDSSLDCVRANHVLEHLYHPRETLAALARKLKPAGRMHLALPNPRGAAATIFRSRWRGLDCPRHVTLYPPQTLRRLLSELGYTDVKIVDETVAKDLVGSLGYLMRDAGLIGRERGERMLRSQGVAGLFRVPAVLASTLGRADVFHTFVRKGPRSTPAR